MSLNDILNAREQRWMQKSAYAREEKRAVVSLTLRLPLELRMTLNGQKALDAGTDEVRALLERLFKNASFKGRFGSQDGPYALFTVSGDEFEIKKALVRFEEESRLGEFIDADVMKPDGEEISRLSVGGSTRKCLVCGGADARVCLSGRIHTRESAAEIIRAKLEKQLMQGDNNMLWMIASDIHGSYDYCEMLMKRFEEKKADRLILLGDLLYHGPRNDLPKGYAPKKVAALLNQYAHRILCVRGNCEAEVDQMMLSFPVLGDYAFLYLDGATVYATHGHHAGESNPPPIKNGEILLCGHTHIPKCTEHEGFVYMNPGSVSIPKEGSAHSFMTLENGVFKWENLETGEVYDTYRV